MTPPHTHTHMQLTTLLSTLATASPDQPAYFALLSVLGSAVSHMTCDDIITQLHLVWYLLDMTRDQLSCVPEVCAWKRAVQTIVSQLFFSCTCMCSSIIIVQFIYSRYKHCAFFKALESTLLFSLIHFMAVFAPPPPSEML